jgi:SAM-dependent methyltransferase
VAVPVSDASFTQVFTRALRGHRCTVVGLGDEPQALPVQRWADSADGSDALLLDQCQGPTLDVGCGPGRLTERLAERGQVVLGIDIVRESVRLTRDRGVVALERDVFDALPGEGRWGSALLADGNVGIGGDPVALLARLRGLLDPRGRVVAEVAPPGVALRTVWVALECDGTRSRPFRWAVVGVDDIAALADAAGFGATRCSHHQGRWCAVLQEAA